MKGLWVTEIENKIKFEEVWGKLEAKNCFQRQSFTQYLRQTLVFMWNCKIRESLISIFHQSFAGNNKIFILGGGLDARLKFYEVSRFSWPFLIS